MTKITDPVVIKFLDGLVEMMRESNPDYLDPREAKCAECKFSARCMMSGHHLECHFPNGKVELSFLIQTPSTHGLPLVHFSDHGVKNGWAMWPMNFDPIWLEWCFLFQNKE